MGLFWKGIGLVLMGLVTIVWWIVKVLASLFLAVHISNYYGLTGLVWYSAVIVIFALLCKVLFYNNTFEYYRGLIDDYSKEVEESNQRVLDDY